MQLILALIVLIFASFVLWLPGKFIIRFLNITEEDTLLYTLINLSTGIVVFIILVNFISLISRSFNIGLLAVIILLATFLVTQLKEILQLLNSLKEHLNKKGFFAAIKTNKYLVLLFGIINFIYGSVAFTTTKMNHFGIANNHIFNINQLLNGTYPLKYQFLPNIIQKYHYGADILGASLSKFSNLNAELSLDLLTLVFLNLSLLTICTITKKLLSTNNINPYIVSIFAFLAWGPIVNLFSYKNIEPLPKEPLQKLIFISQDTLPNAANTSGLVFNWFFSPSIGISTFFFLIVLYLIYRFLQSKKDLKRSIFLGAYISSFFILDISKLATILCGVIAYLLFSPIPFLETTKFNSTLNTIKNLTLIFLVVIVLGLVNGNCFQINKIFIPFMDYYKFGTSNIDQEFSPFYSNLILMLMYTFGFFVAYKERQSWVSFIFPFFLVSLFFPYMFSFPNNGVGVFFMQTNLTAAFTIPSVLNYIIQKLQLKSKTNIVYSLLLVVFTFSTLLYWTIGDKEYSLFTFNSGKLTFRKMQNYFKEINKDEIAFLKKLKKFKGTKDKTIVGETQFTKIFSEYGGLFSFQPDDIGLSITRIPLKPEIYGDQKSNLFNAFSLNPKFWLDNKINFIYLTPKIIKYTLLPDSRKRLLNAYINNGVRLVYSNRSQDLFNLKELYYLDPLTFLRKPGRSLSPNILTNKEIPEYIKQVSLSEYFAIYNHKSNDFNGDNVADIAFFDQTNKNWHIVYLNKDKTVSDQIIRTNHILELDSQTPYLPIPSDYDGDSKTDIALFNPITREWSIIQSSTSQISRYRWGNEIGELPLPADLDGDTKTDISVYNSISQSSFPSLLSSTNYQFSNIGTITSPIDITAYSDIDGDNKADYIIFKPHESSFNVFLSTKGYNLTPPLVIKSGNLLSRVVLDDFDGDKKVDLATWTPNDGAWEIHFSKYLLSNEVNDNEEAGPKSFITVLGGPGDIPMPGDYDGDGKSDIGILHHEIYELEILYSNKSTEKINLSRFKGFTPANIIGI